MMLVHPSSFDYIDIKLKCIECGKISDDAIDAELQTKIAAQPETRRIKPGDSLLGKEIPEKASYFRVNPNYDPRSFVCVEDWQCEHCGPFKWMQFEVREAKLKAGRVVRLDEETMRKSDVLPLAVVQTIPADWLRAQNINVRRLFDKDRERFIQIVTEYAEKIRAS